MHSFGFIKVVSHSWILLFLEGVSDAKYEGLVRITDRRGRCAEVASTKRWNFGGVRYSGMLDGQYA